MRINFWSCSPPRQREWLSEGGNAESRKLPAPRWFLCWEVGREVFGYLQKPRGTFWGRTSSASSPPRWDELGLLLAGRVWLEIPTGAFGSIFLGLLALQRPPPRFLHISEACHQPSGRQHPGLSPEARLGAAEPPPPVEGECLTLRQGGVGAGEAARTGLCWGQAEPGCGPRGGRLSPLPDFFFWKRLINPAHNSLSRGLPLGPPLLPIVENNTALHPPHTPSIPCSPEATVLPSFYLLFWGYVSLQF